MPTPTGASSRRVRRRAASYRQRSDPGTDLQGSGTRKSSPCCVGILLPLYRLLRPFKLINKTYVSQGPFDEGVWPVFDAYARRVKRLTLITKEDDERVAYATIQRLSRRRPCFLPDLKDLDCPLVLPINIPLFSLLSPTLERLELGGEQTAYEEVIEPAVSTIIYESSTSRLNLKRLILHGNTPTSLLGSLCQLSNLLQLSISVPVGFNFLKEVGRLENLEDLTIALPDSPVLPDGELGFEKLRTLNITSSVLPLRVILLGILTKFLSSINITAIRLPRGDLLDYSKKKGGKGVRTSATVPTYDILTECFKILNSRWRLSLQSITLGKSSSYYKAAPLPLDAFSSLSCFERLENLQLCHLEFCPTDTGIHDLALVCPNLQELYLPLDCPNPPMDPRSVSVSPNAMFSEGGDSGGIDDIASSQSQTRATIVSLWSLVKLCPKLTHLQISFDISIIPLFTDSNIHSHGLSHLSVGSCGSVNIGSTRTFDIARHIHRLFPHLTIQSHHGHNSVTWEQIGYAVDAYNKVAVDEHLRGLKQHALVSQASNFLSH